MAKINILPSKVYNRIAAGEVIERPYSVVKELVENAIDAGATEIEIRIENGGKQLIKVTDNGCGIEREDLQSAFLPHATSKIADIEDLNGIMTLGFRGEAIASISAVSKMTITSRTENGKCYSLTCDGGTMGRIIECSGEKGTEVTVETLFHHTPVRLGFLKSEKAEETEITNFVSRFILNRSDISFTYYANGKKILQSFGGGEEEALVSVYGASSLAQCYAINAEKHGIRIRGYIGNTNFYKANKSYQSVFLNGRYIVNTTIASAISNAYAGYLMKRQYPFYVLHIEVPTEIVDVNVHPNKADVRFADNQIIYGCIYSVVAAILDGQSKALEYIVKTPQEELYAPTQKVEEIKIEAPVQPASTSEAKETDAKETFTYEQAKKEVEENSPAFYLKKQLAQMPTPDPETFPAPLAKAEPQVISGSLDSIRGKEDPYFQLIEYPSKAPRQQTRDFSAFKEQYPGLNFDEVELIIRDDKTPKRDYFAENKQFLAQSDKYREGNRIDPKNFHYIGKAFNTYLIYESGDDLYFIDQHAAHERLLFDKLKEQMENRLVLRQPVLLPYTYKGNSFEASFLRDHAKLLYEIGFSMREVAENSFEIFEVPHDLNMIDCRRFIHELLGYINDYRAIKLEDILRDKLASAACKMAVKAGMDLTQAEIDKLFEMMAGDMGLKCPHGRPVVVKMPQKQIEKLFKRIV